jgi:hypothetical protein
MGERTGSLVFLELWSYVKEHVGYGVSYSLAILGTRVKKKEESLKTYNTGDSLVVTHPTTNPALLSLSMGERTGSRVV